MSRLFCDRCKKEIVIPRFGDGTPSEPGEHNCFSLIGDDGAGYIVKVVTKAHRKRSKHPSGSRERDCDLCPSCIAHIIIIANKERKE